MKEAIAVHHVGPVAHQATALDEVGPFPPPGQTVLRGEGNKIQHPWLFGFLKNVELIRPALFMRPEYEAGKLGIRMPSFPITDDEATAVAEYFASVSNHESKDLKQRLDTVIKYVDAQRKLSVEALPAPQKVWPGDDWIDKEIYSQTREYLKNWVLDRKLMTWVIEVSTPQEAAVNVMQRDLCLWSRQLGKDK